MSISLSGLDLSFLKKPAAVKRGRYRIDAKSGDLVTAREWYRRNPQRSKRSDKVAAPYFMPDVDSAYGGSWKSIIDGTEISSRPNWREHNKRNGVLQVDPDYWGKTNDDYITENKERMGYDPSLIGDPDFQWKVPD